MGSMPRVESSLIQRLHASLTEAHDRNSFRKARPSKPTAKALVQEVVQSFTQRLEKAYGARGLRAPFSRAQGAQPKEAPLRFRSPSES